MPGYFLALDQGGHASRALLFDGAGEQVFEASAPVRLLTPGPERAEYDTTELLESLRKPLLKALEYAPGRVVAVGLATQRSNVACWDPKTGEAKGPVLGWQDRRGRALVEELKPWTEEIKKRSGLVLTPYYGASKLRWCLEEKGPEIHFGPMAAWLAARLTGRVPERTDPVNAQRTQLMNVRTLDWDPFLLARFGIPRAHLPAIGANTDVIGEVGGVPLTLVTGDQQAALFAHGELGENTAYVNAGTGAFVLRYTGARLVEHERLLTGVLHVDQKREYLIEGTVNGAGAALAWFQQRFRVKDLFKKLPGWLETIEPAPVLFLNTVNGLGSPFWAAGPEPGFVGEGSVAEHAVAVVESIVFLIQENLRALAEVLPPPKRILLTGGLARLDGLAQRLADLAGVPVERPQNFEATARGTAFLLAGRPAGWETPIKRFLPRKNPALKGAYARWQKALAAQLP